MKLYVVVKQALLAGLKIPQALHAFRAFQTAFPVLENYWHQEHNNIVVLQVEDLEALTGRLEAANLRLAKFREPDRDDELTAICVEPNAQRMLSNLALAR